MKNKRAQAITEYTLLIALMSIVFVTSSKLFDTAIKSIFKSIGTFFSKIGP